MLRDAISFGIPPVLPQPSFFLGKLNSVELRRHPIGERGGAAPKELWKSLGEFRRRVLVRSLSDSIIIPLLSSFRLSRNSWIGCWMIQQRLLGQGVAAS
jgi:hypothetical protein